VSYRKRLENGRLKYDDVDATPPHWHPTINLNKAVFLEYLVEMTNAAFCPSNETLDPWAENLIRERLHLEPLRQFGTKKNPIDRVGIFKRLLEGRVDRGLELLKGNQYNEVIQLWQPLQNNLLFSVGNPAWDGLAYYKAEILQAKCELFIARVNIQEGSDFKTRTKSAFSAMAELVDAAPIPIEEGSDNSLRLDQAVAVNGFHLRTLEFAHNWVDSWGAKTMIRFAEIQQSTGADVISQLRVRLDQVTDILREYGL
jgi:hypothetical protein